MALTAELWNEVGVKLWNQATRCDKTAAGFLYLWLAVLEILKGQESARKELSWSALSATGSLQKNFKQPASAHKQQEARLQWGRRLQPSRADPCDPQAVRESELELHHNNKGPILWTRIWQKVKCQHSWES